jgi:hypothetical protein
VGDISYLTAFGVSGGMALVLFCWAAWLIGSGYRLRS